MSTENNKRQELEENAKMDAIAVECLQLLESKNLTIKGARQVWCSVMAGISMSAPFFMPFSMPEKLLWGPDYEWNGSSVPIFV